MPAVTYRGRNLFYQEAGEGPVLFNLPSEEISSLLISGALEPVDSSILDTSLFIDGSFEGVTLGGKIYGIPREYTNWCLYVNKAMLDAAGLGQPRTWEDIAEIANICSEYDITKAKKIIIGGDTRAGSVYNGVMETAPGAYLIAVHDGARPLVTDDIITKAVLKASVTNAAAPAVPIKDTVKSVVDGKIIGTPDRSTLYAFQTPQVFSGDILKGALQNALEKRLPITDDCMAVEALGIPIYVTEGSYENIKITTPSDLDIAEMILERREDENR